MFDNSRLFRFTFPNSPLQSSPTLFESVSPELFLNFREIAAISTSSIRLRLRLAFALAFERNFYRTMGERTRNEFTTITRRPTFDFRILPSFIFVSRLVPSTSTSVEGWRAVTLNVPWRLKSTRTEGDSRLEKSQREDEQRGKGKTKRRGHRPPWKHSINNDEKELSGVCETDFVSFFTGSDGYVLIVEDKRLSHRVCVCVCVCVWSSYRGIVNEIS